MDNDKTTADAFAVFAGVAVPVFVFTIICFCIRRKPTDSSDLEAANYAPMVSSPGRIESSGPRRAGQHDGSEAGFATSPRLSRGARRPRLICDKRKARLPDEAAVVRLCHDPAIQQIKIPVDEIQLSKVLNHGARGQVYRGVYDGEPIAVKRLPPALRLNMKAVATFLEEAKLMTALHHANIVQLIGVAWNTDAESIKEAMQELSVVSEFMEGGDLRSLLSYYQTTDEPKGFHSDNVRIAIDIARAIVYLHEFKPRAIVHRNLKSRNVLLTRDLDAKLTGFGVSSVRAEATMPVAVGSCLWTAPEIVFGRPYDAKADLFSFGVVLSELDTHELPYSQAVHNGSGHRLAEMTIVKMVSEGSLSVRFSRDADDEIVALAKACASHEPSRRPTASEALARLEKCLDRLTCVSEPTSRRWQTATMTSRMY